MSKDKLIDSFKDKDLLYQPGSEWTYSNCNYQLLAFIIEKVSKQTYEEYVMENIFKPAGMINTGCDTGKVEIENLALGYSMIGGKLMKAHPINMSVTFGSGHIYSTAEDMYKLYKSLHSEDLVSRASLTKMMGNNTGLKDEFGYGLFLGELGGQKWVGHGGNLTNGYSSNFIIFPDEKKVIILLTNISFQDTTEVTNTLGLIMMGKDYIIPKKLEPVKLDSEILKKYEGIYETDNGERIELKLIDKELYSIGSNSKYLALVPYSDIDFYPKEHPSTRVKILIDKKGQVEGLISKESSMTIKGKKKN